MLKELTVGKITNKALAEWFGVSVSPIQHNKEKYLNILKRYAKFEMRGEKNKSIYITEVLNPIYDKEDAFKLVKKLTRENWDYDNLDTCSNVSDKIYPDVIEAGFELKPSTNYVYTRMSKNELFGKCGDIQGGEEGISDYVWGKKQGNIYVPLSEKEREIFAKVACETYHNPTEKFMCLIELAIKNPNEGQELLEQYKVQYNSFFVRVKAALGFTPIRCTKVTKRD